MRASLNDKAPMLLLLLASVALAVGFTLPIGAERLEKTRYQRLEGFIGSFESAKAAAAAAKAVDPAQSDTLGMLARAVRRSYTPVEANALLSRVQHMTQTREEAARPAPPPRKTRRPAARVTPAVAVSTPVVHAVAAPAPPPEPRAAETMDSVGEDYERDAAKYHLDASAAQGAVTLSLRGLSRSGPRFILKVAVRNRGGEDFFVRELVLREGKETLAAKAYMRLFVEPGRTREGFIVFDRPRPGAAVHVALKEDREKGRVVELAVPYPF